MLVSRAVYQRTNVKGKKMATKIIAEIGWNFMGDMDLAKEMVKSAKRSGADIAKFQYWNPDRLKKGAWDNDGRREIYENAKLTEEKIKQLIDYCDDAKIQFLVSVFNVVDAKFVKSLGVKAIKIPSHEVANYQLHEFVANNFDCIYVSLGAGTENEIEKAAQIYRQSADSAYVVGMHCVSSYPCPAEKANLPRLNFISDHCKRVGYSDHTSDVLTPAIALAYGVEVIEKHFTTDKNLPGRDNKFALNPAEFRDMVDNIRLAEQCLTSHGNGNLDIERDTMTSYRGRWGGND